MMPTLAVTEADREQSRTLINSIFPEHQPTLRKDVDLISLNDRDHKLAGSNKELAVLKKDNKVMGTVLLELARDHNVAYISYLTRHPELPKGSGKILLEWAESRAKNAYKSQEIRLSIIYHPEHVATSLETFYVNEGYQFFARKTPDPSQRLGFQPQYQEQACFMYYKKQLGENIKP